MEKISTKRQIVILIILVALIVITTSAYDYLIRILGAKGFVLVIYVLPVILLVAVSLGMLRIKTWMNFFKGVSQSPEKEKEQEVEALKRMGNVEGAKRIEAMSLSQISAMQKASALFVITGLIFSYGSTYFGYNLKSSGDYIVFVLSVAVIGVGSLLYYKYLVRKVS